MSLQLKRDDGRMVLSDSFGARVEGSELLLPAEIWEWAKQSGTRSVEEFLSSLQTFPSSMAEHLGWSVERVKEAEAGLVKLLRGHVAEQFLSPPAPVQRAYGALPPPGMTLPVVAQRRS